MGAVKAGEFDEWTAQFSEALDQAADGSSGDRKIDSIVRLFGTIHLRALGLMMTLSPERQSPFHFSRIE